MTGPVEPPRTIARRRQSLALLWIVGCGFFLPREAGARQVPPTEEVFRSFSDRVVKIDV